MTTLAVAPNYRALRSLPPKGVVVAMELARRRLIDFLSFTWPDVHRPFHLTRFHQALAQILEHAVENRQNVIISTPPQHGKSTLVSMAFPAWWLGKHPGNSVILTSYAASLAYRNSRAIRDLVESRAFRALYPGVRTDPSSRAVDQWRLAAPHSGRVVAAGVGGPITGHGADLGIIDDPFENWMQAHSKTYRDRVWDWYKGTFRTRIHAGGTIVIISTRWHPDDLIGRLLKEQSERWAYYNFQAIFEGNCGRPDPLGRSAGEPLAPELYPLAELERIRADVGDVVWEAEYQGCPREVTETFIDVSRFRIVDEVSLADKEIVTTRVRYWDLAASDAPTASYIVGLRLEVTSQGRWFITDVVRFRALWPRAREIIRGTILRDGPGVLQGIENVAFQRAAYDDLRSLIERTHRIQKVRVVGDKVARTAYFIGPLTSGRLYVLQRPWLQEFLDEMREFPHGVHDDQVDALSGAAFMARQVVPRRARGRSWL